MDAELVRFAGKLLDEAIRAEGEGFQQELRKLHGDNHTLFMLSNAWKRLLPRTLRNAPGIRHIGALGHKLLG